MLRRREAWMATVLLLVFAAGPPSARSQTTDVAPEPAADATGGEDVAADPPHLPDPEGVTAMPAPDRVWIDAENHEVLVDGYVALREGYLEMFACTVGTKEHESVVAVETKAATVHAALLAVGAKEGHPVRFRPKFEPPAGTEIEIEVRWMDAAGEWQSARAQEWIREVKSRKEMSHDWVFAGSGFWTDEETGKRYYMAEAGDFICVSNFTTATLDVPIESSPSNDGLMFEAYTDRIPPLATPVRLVLKPVLESEPASERSDDGDRDDASK
jgi:hypothetical protein